MVIRLQARGWGNRLSLVALFVVIALAAGLVGFLFGSISAAISGSTGGAGKILITITSTQTLVRSTVVTTTLTTATPTTVTETKIYTKTISKTVPPDVFEVPAGEWLTEDGKVSVKADVVIEDGKTYYIRIKVTNIGNETLRHIMMIFVPYVGGKPLLLSQNIIILRDVEAGETRAQKFRISSPDTPFKILVLSL